MSFHFYDLLDNLDVNVKHEVDRLHELFSVEKLFGYRSGDKIISTFEDFVNDRFFRTLSFRGTFLDTLELRHALDISEFKLGFGRSGVTPKLEQFFLFAEFLFAIIIEAEETISTYPVLQTQVNTITANIMAVANKTNHELMDVGEENVRYIIVEKNKLTTAAVEAVDEENIAIDCIEYNHYQLKGNISRKRNILRSIGHYIEPILNSNVLRENGYSNLQSDAGFVLNNLHIRHNNKEGAKANDYIGTVSNKQLEEWYDKSYNILLSVIVASKNIEIHKDLADLKKTYSWKN